MVGLVRFHLFAASATPIPVIAGIRVAQTDFRFQIPMAAKDKGVAVLYARTDKPALIAGIFQLPEVSAQHIDFPVESADVVLSAM